jgi:hypothetical protein
MRQVAYQVMNQVLNQVLVHSEIAYPVRLAMEAATLHPIANQTERVKYAGRSNTPANPEVGK